MAGPMTFDQARAYCDAKARAQEAAENALRAAGKRFAQARRAYQTALTTRSLKYKSRGFAVTTCGDLARGDEDIAALREKKDIAEADLIAAKSALWRHNHNRKDALEFTDWSKRRELAEGYAETPDMDWTRQPSYPAEAAA